ncbi:globin [Myxococcus sp. CA056]|uniref:group II truncated hemoglobin n=1 Tax=Myxococcus sp. CA056 TaxID=2741740 RepID=UPI00157AF1D2|nr:globin [Myxococcus sp. CA056]
MSDGGAASAVPTLYAWAGGAQALARLTECFYARVRTDALLGPIFERMSARHPAHVALFLGEVLGGPRAYSEAHGGHPGMLRHHLERHLTEAQRRRWTDLLLDSANEVELPSDPEFRSAFVAYVEWGSRLAVINSQPGASVTLDGPMPTWGWGVPGGPYRPET